MKPGRYRKKPVEVEAVDVAKLLAMPVSHWPMWANELERHGLIGVAPPAMKIGRMLLVMTLQGQQVAAGVAEILVWNPEGHDGRDVWPVVKDVFRETYEPV